MKKLLAALVAMLVLPMAFAVSTGGGIEIDVTPTEWDPAIWQCDQRVVIEDCVEAGRISDCPNPLVERLENYAFEGEQIHWLVLVMDKNKIDEIQEVVGTIGPVAEPGNDIQVECVPVPGAPFPVIPPQCNARLGQLDLTGTPFDPLTQRFYDCTFTVEDPVSMPPDEYFVTVEAISSNPNEEIAAMDEYEYWYLNPVIALYVSSGIAFEDVEPGTASYSNTILVGNDDQGESTGVMLDMFISGTDFYDPDNSGARCPTTNHLKLSQDLRSQASLGPAAASGLTFAAPCNIDAWLDTPAARVDNNDHLCYYAVNGAYSTATAPNADLEGYRPIVYSDMFTRDFYEDAEIIWNGVLAGGYSAGNLLSPGAEIAITFKLGLPEPCVGNFNQGDIYFWGEAA